MPRSEEWHCQGSKANVNRTSQTFLSAWWVSKLTPSSAISAVRIPVNSPLIRLAKEHQRVRLAWSGFASCRSVGCSA